MGLLGEVFATETTSVSDLTNPKYWLEESFGGAATVSGERVTESTAMGLSTYYACKRVVSEDVGKLPFLLHRKLDRGRERAVDHPLYKLLHDSPHPFMSSQAWRETLTDHAQAWGNGYSRIYRKGRKVVELSLPIHPSRVTVKFDEDDHLVYDVRVYDNKGHYKGLERWRDSEMFHLHGCGGDGIGGYSVIQMARESLGMGLAAQKFGAAMFGNGVTFSGLLEYPGQLDDAEVEHLKETWKASHGGAGNAMGMGVLEQGLKWVQTGIPPQDAQFLETRQFQVVEVCRWFRMPPHKVQHLADATFTNIEHQGKEYVDDTLMAWNVRWEQEVRRKLLGGYEEDEYAPEILVTALLRGDTAARSAFYTALFNIGALSPNDIAELENGNPIGPEGDMRYIQSNMTTLTAVAEEKNLKAATEKNSGTATGDRESKAEEVRVLFLDAAGRVARKEARAVSRAQKKFAGDPAGLEAWAEKFYVEHRAYLVETFAPLMSVCGGDMDLLEGAAGAICIQRGTGEDADFVAMEMMSLCRNGDER